MPLISASRSRTSLLELTALDERCRCQRIRLGGLKVAEAEVRRAAGVQDRADDPGEPRLLGKAEGARGDRYGELGLAGLDQRVREVVA